MTNAQHHAPGGGFRNPWPGAEPKGLANLLRWFAERHTTKRPPPDPDPSVFPLATPRLGQAAASGDLDGSLHRPARVCRLYGPDRSGLGEVRRSPPGGRAAAVGTGPDRAGGAA